MIEIVHDRAVEEIFRGCIRGCRFCQAGFTYRPIREKSVDVINDQCKRLIQNTGYDEISLCSLSTSDHSHVNEMLSSLIDWTEKSHINLSLPSLRVDNFSDELVDKLNRVRKSGLTFAAEAGTQRLRDVINKNITEEEILRTCSKAFDNGWCNVKLYFMIGLPTETLQDLDGIGDLARKCVSAYFAVPKEQRAKGLRVTCSASSFVPKPFTPFQWEPQDTQQQIKDKQAYLRGVLRGIKGVNFNWHEPELSYLEACFARGDRRMGQVLLKAFELGCILDGWSEQFKFDKWMEAFETCHVDPEFYAYRRREKNEILPWDFIDAGVTKQYLWHEKEKAERAETTKDCRKGCNGCGLQRYEGVCSFCK